MGRVYLAEDMDLGRKVAIKVLSENLTGNREYTERFRREARAVAAIGHPNIVQVYEIGQTDEGCPFLVMELLEGSDLHSVLNTVGVLSVERAVDVLGQVLFALSAAHRVGIVHRDLKPENIFLTSRAVTSWSDFEDTTSSRRSPETAKILDFGISRFIEPVGSGAPQLTQSGVVLGTPFYIAPEQIRDVAHVDGRADLFAAGVILFECLTGALPFTGDNVHTILHNVLAQPTPDPLVRRPDLPEGLAAVITRAMEKDPNPRFPDADSFIEALMPYARKTSAKSNSWTGGRPFELPGVALGRGSVQTFDSGELLPLDELVDAVTLAADASGKMKVVGSGKMPVAPGNGVVPVAAAFSPASPGPASSPQIAVPAAFSHDTMASPVGQVFDSRATTPGPASARRIGLVVAIVGVVLVATVIGTLAGLGVFSRESSGSSQSGQQGAGILVTSPPVPVRPDAGAPPVPPLPVPPVATDAAPVRAPDAGPAIASPDAGPAPVDAAPVRVPNGGRTKVNSARNTALDEAIARARTRARAGDREGCLAALEGVPQTPEVTLARRRCLDVRPRPEQETRPPTKNANPFARDNPFGH
jgi:serine/threonine protein kinase